MSISLGNELSYNRFVTIPYEMPRQWILFDLAAIQVELLGAKAAMLALTQIPYQRSWAEQLQQIQLKREVAGTSRIEGAEFTERELDAAMREAPQQLETRSQRQAACALATYRWIAKLETNRPVDESLVCEIHRRIVSGCDDDHCPPGRTRGRDDNVTFGTPRHRGVEGGDDCQAALRELCQAARTIFRNHDPLIQALALHYHFAAMHPFLDGNGRTARALEALMLQRVGLGDTLFIAMSNYYYEEKNGYLIALAETRALGHDLTPFLKFALKGIEKQCNRLFSEIRLYVAKALYRNTMADLFGRLRSPRKRVMSDRHMQLLQLLLDRESLNFSEIIKQTMGLYHVKNPLKALVRDLSYLATLQAIEIKQTDNKLDAIISINLNWPTQITESEFFKRVKEMPKAKIHGFLSS
jgi:Fic family protein